ncbi:MAG TPA: multidrug ABC transporter ATP-binding protein [Clostridiales bacterium]|nr:multidrug ABC transporter ATP-binding protein [Clostridiales bacterium]
MGRLIKELGKKELILFLLSVGIIALQVWAELELIDRMQEVTKLVVAPGGTTTKVLYAGAKMLALATVGVLCSVAVGYAASVIGANLSYKLRGKLFHQVQLFSMEEINRFSTASLITRSTNDITQVQTLVSMGMLVALRAPIMAVWAMSKIATKNWQWSITVIAAVVMLCLLLACIFLIAVPRFKKIQKLTDDINERMRENLTGLRVVHAFNAESFQEKKFANANEALAKNNLVAHRVMASIHPVMTAIMSGLSLSIYWIGFYLIDAAKAPDKLNLYSEMVVFSSYAMQIVMSFMMMSFIFIMFPRAMVSARRIREVLTTDPKIKPGDRKDGLPGVKGEVRFENVSFAYPDAENPILEHITFEANEGETVAFIGSTGSGKTTVINLIPRFYDVTSGGVFVDGVNVKEYDSQALVEKIGYVSQKAVLFSGTVTSNVTYGNEGRKEERENVFSALKTASAYDFVMDKEGQESAVVARGGANYSGGQKQRLSIARALYKKPEILIFDDSFSALDYKTDKELRAALKKQAKGTTLLIVAQRIGTIMDADKIIVLDEGKISAMGTHRELLKTSTVYREIAESQLSEEELDNE